MIIDKALPEAALAKSIVESRFPLYLIEYWEKNLANKDLRENAYKLDLFLQNGLKQQLRISVFFGVLFGLVFFFLIFSTGVPAQNGTGDGGLIKTNPPLAFLLLGAFLVLYSIFFGFVGLLFGHLAIDYPRYRVMIWHFRSFLYKLITTAGLTFDDLLRMTREQVIMKVDELIINLAVKVRENEKKYSEVPDVQDTQEKAEFMQQIDDLFDYFKLFDLVHTDKQGGYGWHFKQADTLIRRSES